MTTKMNQQFPKKDINPSATQRSNGLLETLKEYKEIITICVFFFGGLSWISLYFATRSQVEEIKCINTLNIQMIRAKIDVQFLDKILSDNALQQKSVEENIDESDASSKPYKEGLRELNALSEQRKDFKGKKDIAEKQVTDAFEKLTTGFCTK